jgi:phage tail sheath protein FI
MLRACTLAVAGMLAKGDEAVSVWAAAEAEEPILRPGFRPVCWVADDRRARLALQGVNVLQTVRSASRTNVRLRTLGASSAAEPDWRYLANRRRALAILNSIERGTRWVAAWPYSDVAPLLERQVTAFLGELHAAGTFGEHRAEDAFFIFTDRRPAGGRELERQSYHFLVGFAAERPGQFHTFRISHSPFGSQVRAVTLSQLGDARPLPRLLRSTAAQAAAPAPH